MSDMYTNSLPYLPAQTVSASQSSAVRSSGHSPSLPSAPATGTKGQANFAQLLANKQEQPAPTYNRVSDAAKQAANEAATEFESFFIYQMLDLTRPETDKELGGSFAEEQFQQLQNEFIADEMAQQRSFGIGNAIYKQLMEKQEGLR